MMYTIQNNKAPVNLWNLLKEKAKPVSNLRSNNNTQLALGKPRTVYSGTKIWNNLPCQVKQCKSLDTFKQQLASVRPKTCHYLSISLLFSTY